MYMSSYMSALNVIVDQGLGQFCNLIAYQQLLNVIACKLDDKEHSIKFETIIVI